MQDNFASITWEKGHPAEALKWSKHIETNSHNIRDKTESSKIMLEKICSPDMAMNFLTKVLTSEQIPEANDLVKLVDINTLPRTP